MGKYPGIATCLTFVMGCSTTATVSRRSGPPIEGQIKGGSPNTIAVDTGGGEVVVPRSDITEVDHPGNVHTLIGGLLLGYGVLNIAVGAPECENRPKDERTAYCIGVFTPAVLGASIMIWGLVTNGGSKSGANDISRHDPPFPPPNTSPYVPGYAIPSWHPQPVAPPPHATPKPTPPATPPAAVPSAPPVTPAPADEEQPPVEPAPTSPP
jgi:hypothetical protein